MGHITDLSGDIFLLIITSLDSARDVRSLSLTCRGIHDIVEEGGWWVFVRNRFSSLSIPSTSGDGWRRLAESLTWQSRSWDRRSLQFSSLLPRRKASRPSRSVAGAFQPVIDAVICPETDQELVVWAEGEDIKACYRPRTGAPSTIEATWHHFNGKKFGYSPGYDDVRAIAIVDRPSHDGREILVGRDNGDLGLLSAEPDRFGERLVSFELARDEDTGVPIWSGGNIDQDTVASLDVRGDMVVACTKHSVILYQIPEDDTDTVTPLGVYDLKADSPMRPPKLGSAKWMGDDSMIAVALQGTNQPLRYLTLTPQGCLPSAEGKDITIEGWNRLGCKSICPNSLEPVKLRSSTSKGTTVLLSAWEDGTCRLDDPRTPAPFDVVYQDNVYPWTKMHSLMAYGAERFVGGTMQVATVKIFDFRWTRDYYHTSGLPCSPVEPFPPPSQPFTAVPAAAAASFPAPTCCDHLSGFRCRWHELSRDIYYRPNVSFFLSRSLPRVYENARVWSLARASDVSANFYVGISGGILEANLETVNADGSRGRDPNFGLRDWGSSGAHAEGYTSGPAKATMMETGDGLSSHLNRQNIRIPEVYSMSRQYEPAKFGDVPSIWRKRHRLDSSFQNEEHFRAVKEQVGGGW